MFWADSVAQELKKRKLPLEWVDDMKTPSGRIHVGALRGVVIHDLVYKALLNIGVKAKYTYVFDNHDPMDALPVYLLKETYEQYLGMPLYKVPSPKKEFADYAEYYAQDFINTFTAIGCHPEILWTTDLYKSGKMNDAIKLCLDKTEIIRGIYEELYKKLLAKDWYPFQIYCPKCGKVSTTRVTDWNGEKVTFVCDIDRLAWTKGCGFTGKASPFSDKNGIAGKLPWKIEWAVKWKVIGVTVEGAGKDHMSRGGSHDLASLVCKRVLDYPIPYPIAYEFFLVGGRKMSSSKGLGSSAQEMLEILPPEFLRFLMVKTRINQAINFDPYEPTTIPRLFDEYDKFTESNDPDMARVFELSQIDKMPKRQKLVRFSDVVNLLQMPGKERELERENVKPRVAYAKIWLDRFAAEEEKFTVKEEFPEAALHLSGLQKIFLGKIADELLQEWQPERFEVILYELAKEIGLSSKDAFAAIYSTLIGKDHGPKAAWLILSLDKKFVIERFKEAVTSSVIPNLVRDLGSDGMPKQIQHNNIPSKIFSIDAQLRDKFPSIVIGVAIIKGVKIEKTNKDLEREKEQLLKSLEGLTTEQLGQYPEIQSYRRLYKETGIDWHSRRPSPEALLRRVALKKGLYNINTCVDAYNIVVMKHRVSVGAFDLDKIKLPTVLRFAKRGEIILLLGDNEPTEYREGEIAYFDQQGGFNIDFNYRDAQRTLVTLETKNLYINVDGVFDITPGMVEKSLKETCDMITKYCDGEVKLFGIETT